MKHCYFIFLLLVAACGERAPIEFVDNGKACKPDESADIEEIQACQKMCVVAGEAEHTEWSDAFPVVVECRNQCSQFVKTSDLCTVDNNGNEDCLECNSERTNLRKDGYRCTYVDSCPGGAKWVLID